MYQTMVTMIKDLSNGKTMEPCRCSEIEALAKDYRCPILKYQRRTEDFVWNKYQATKSLNMPSKKEVQDIIKHLTWVR